MDSRGNIYQFRSVPLIQRGDLSALSGADTASSVRGGRSSHVANRLDEDVVEREDRLRSARRTRDEVAEAPSRRSRRRSDAPERGRMRGRVVEGRVREDRGGDERRYEDRTREDRRQRRERAVDLRDEAPMWPETRTPAPSRAHVSAYLDESTVVGVTARSERRRSTSPNGFTVVPSTPAINGGRNYASDWSFDTSWDRGGTAAPRWDEAYDDESAYRTVRGRSARFYEDDDEATDDGRLRRRTRRPREDGTVARDWLYTGEDEEDYRLPGAARRREAIIGALTAIPRGLMAGLMGLLSHTRSLFVLILAAMTAFMLYAPARELYVANRRLDTLQATYDALLEENGSIREDLELLQTREGIENEARSRGYVAQGETKVIVEGLPEEEPTDTSAYVGPLEMPDNRPWYTRLLDQLFNYNPEE